MIRNFRAALKASDTPRTTALIAVVFALVLPLGFAWGLGFPGLVSLAGLFCLPLLRPGRTISLAAGLLFAIVLWSLASMVWSRASIDPHHLRRFADVAKLTGPKLLLQLLFYGAFVAAARRLNRQGAGLALKVLAVAVVSLSGMILIDALLGARIFMWLSAHLDKPIRPDLARRDLSTGLYVVVVLFWCVSVELARAGRRIAIAVAAVCLVAGSLVLNEADATRAAFALGALVFIGVRALGPLAIRMLAGATTIYWLGAPVLIFVGERSGLIPSLRTHIGQSWDRRLDIWLFTAARIVEKPWFGWGLDASRTFGGGISLHPHDGAMQVWLELGLVGVLLFAGLSLAVWRLIDRISQRDRTTAAALAASAVAYLTIGGLSFGIWQEWWLAIAALAVAAGLSLVRAREAGEDA